MEIKPWLTAIHRKQISVPLQKILNLNFLNKNQKILDYGCGHGYDLLHLKNNGFNIIGYDKFIKTYSDDSYAKYSYDIIFCFYVLNTIHLEKDRIEVLSNILNCLKKNGQAFIAVRSIDEFQSQKTETYIEFKDGIVTKKNTFQKYFTSEYLESLIKDNFSDVKFEYIKINKYTLFIKLFK